VLELQACDISVISTVNVQHLASLQDTVRLVTGVTVSETLPDWVVDSADELEIIDQSPEALLKRMRHGNVFPREQVERALESYFRTDTLASLRELTLRRVADHAQRKLQTPERDSPLAAPPCDETILVCLPPGSHAAALLTRGVHLAEQLRARLVVLHVTQPSRGLHLEAQRGHQEAVKALQLARALGAEVHTLHASNVADALIQFAGEVGATQLVLGESTRSRLRELVQGSVMREVLRRTRNVDVHIVRRSEP
jgi:two-component system, OmpR family, sensor histidine kinase KdpD